jgi:intraflagellar transport protein 140
MVKQTLPMTEAEGDITCIEINNKHMVAATSNNLIKIWDVSRRTWRQLGMSRQFEKNKKSLGDIRSVNINADGSKICILGESCPVPSIKIPDTKVHVYDIEMDTFLCHEISKNRMPVEACWDQKDPRLLVVETDYIQDLAKDSSSEEHLSSELDPVVGEESKDKTNDEEHEKTIVTLFVTSENGIKQHLSMGLEEGEEAILGVNVPHYFFLGNSLSAEEEKEKDKDKKERSLSIVRKPMRDFEGLENIDDNIKNAILNFSVHLAYGNMDEAYNAVRNIKNASVWENMAQMCVKTKRLDVAQICLGNMRFARGARAVREAMKEKELEAKLGMVAIHLNLLDEAKELYKECGRYDLLCKLLEASGDWDDALEIAETHDRINLKTLHYKIAQYYEYSYEFDKAVYHYQKSGTSQNEVPRMYWSHDRLNQLQDYIENQKEPDLYKWWAQYLESKKNYDGAIKYYKYAQDYASLVRICCFKDQMAEATQISIESGDPSACYHLARKYESIGNIREAIQFYSRAQRLHHAVRLAREEGEQSK